MSQDQWLLLALKIVLPADIASIAVFAARYHRLTGGGWRKDPIGVTLMAKDLLLLGMVAITAASVFLDFNRLDSRAAAWIQITLLALLSAVMAWRTIVFQREKDGPDNGGTS